MHTKQRAFSAFLRCAYERRSINEDERAVEEAQSGPYLRVVVQLSCLRADHARQGGRLARGALFATDLLLFLLVALRRPSIVAPKDYK